MSRSTILILCTVLIKKQSSLLPPRELLSLAPPLLTRPPLRTALPLYAGQRSCLERCLLPHSGVLSYSSQCCAKEGLGETSSPLFPFFCSRCFPIGGCRCRVAVLRAPWLLLLESLGVAAEPCELQADAAPPRGLKQLMWSAISRFCERLVVDHTSPATSNLASLPRPLLGHCAPLRLPCHHW
jgi:hypothetical protein